MWPHLVLTVLFKPRLGVNSRWFHTRALFPFTALKAPASSILSESRTKLGPGRDERQIQHDGISQGMVSQNPFAQPSHLFRPLRALSLRPKGPGKNLNKIVRTDCMCGNPGSSHSTAHRVAKVLLESHCIASWARYSPTKVVAPELETVRDRAGWTRLQKPPPS